MTPEQFVYWLQGKLEGRDHHSITPDDIKMIQDHLKTVFTKITPTYIPQPIPMPSQPPMPPLIPQPWQPNRIGDDPSYPNIIC
jgi:hypothetical protein